MNNTNNHDGLFDDCATAIIHSVITAIDTGKRSVKLANHFSVLKVPSIVVKRK